MFQNAVGVNILLVNDQQGWTSSEGSEWSLKRSVVFWNLLGVMPTPPQRCLARPRLFLGLLQVNLIFEPLSPDKKDTSLEKAAAPTPPPLETEE